VGGAVIIGLLLFLLMRGPAAPVAPPVDHQAQAVLSAAVEAQLDSARRSLEFKDPEGAIVAAEKALRFEPDNREAQDIVKRARALLNEVEALAGEARQAAQAGNLDEASQALAKVLDRMPRHPVAAELSAQLASRFKAKADGAAKEMNRAADAARRAGASSLRAYAEAANHASLAQSAYSRKQYTEAAQRFAEAQRSYEASTRDARDLASKRAATVTGPPAVVVPQPTPPPTVAPVAAPPRPTLAPAPAPSAVVTTPPARSVRDDDAAIRLVVENLKRAIEGKDLALYKRVRPGLSADEERRLRDAFRNVASQEVDYQIDGITLSGDKATVKVIRGGRVAGQSVPRVPQTLRLVRGENGWIIDEIGQ
jgi:tetratricopeptide (TPR) repeat protein